MRTRFLVLSLVLPLAAACGTARYAPPGALATVAPLRVSGRQGALASQRLSFGPYSTGEVARSTTRGTESRDTLGSSDARYSQRYAFSLALDSTRAVNVDCWAEGSAPGAPGVTRSMVRVLECLMYTPDGALHTLYLRSSRSEPLAGGVRGINVRVEGSTRVGRGRVSATAGYAITRANGTPLAAVDVTNDGAVYLAAPGDYLSAAIAAVLLVFQDPLLASENFRDR